MSRSVYTFKNEEDYNNCREQIERNLSYEDRENVDFNGYCYGEYKISLDDSISNSAAESAGSYAREQGGKYEPE